jgi:ADP-ribose pyrophosphatase YjhB (NUDIX family)
MVHCNKNEIYLQKNVEQENQGYIVGVSAIILNSREEVLMVQERNGPVSGMWGFPSG